MDFLRFPPKCISDIVCLFKGRGRDDSTENFKVTANPVFKSSLSFFLVHHKKPQAKWTGALNTQTWNIFLYWCHPDISVCLPVGQTQWAARCTVVSGTDELPIWMIAALLFNSTVHWHLAYLKEVSKSPRAYSMSLRNSLYLHARILRSYILCCLKKMKVYGSFHIQGSLKFHTSQWKGYNWMIK